jgi:hypothetical protein
MVGVAGEGDVEAILEVDQALHCVGRRRIHANLTVMNRKVGSTTSFTTARFKP